MPSTFYIQGIPITDPTTDDRTTAIETWNSRAAADPEGMQETLAKISQREDTRRIMKANQKKFGLSDDDIENIISRAQGQRSLEGAGEAPSVLGSERLGKFGVGLARQSESAINGAMQLGLAALERVPGGKFVIGGLDPKVARTELAEEELEARTLFEQLDKQTAGFGAEDIGQYLAEGVQFAGGGAVSVGLKVLGRTAGKIGGNIATKSVIGGAMVSGLEEASKGPGSAVAMNAALGGGLGLVGAMIPGGVSAVRKMFSNAPATVNILGSMVAMSGNNTAFGMGLLARGLHGAQQAKKYTTKQIERAVQSPEAQAAIKQGAEIATSLRDAIGTTISVLKRQHQSTAASQYAAAAYEQSLKTVSRSGRQTPTPQLRELGRAAGDARQRAATVAAAERAYKASFGQSQGRTTFLAAEFNTQLGLFTDPQLKKLGQFGIDLMNMRRVTKVIERLQNDVMDISEFKVLMQGLNTNPMAKKLIPALESASKPEARANILQRMLKHITENAPQVAVQQANLSQSPR